MDSMVSAGGRSGAGVPGLAASVLGGSGFGSSTCGTCSNGLGGLGCCGAGCCWLKRGTAASRPNSAAGKLETHTRRPRGLENCIYPGFLSTLRLFFWDVRSPNWVSHEAETSGDLTAATVVMLL